MTDHTETADDDADVYLDDDRYERLTAALAELLDHPDPATARVKPYQIVDVLAALNIWPASVLDDPDREAA